MYPRNAASPERVALGAVVQISDGAVQTSGVSVKVRPQGALASAGGGTTAYEEGVVLYTPTQAETDYTSFVLIAYKTGCIPVSVTVVTSASSTAGHAGTDQSKIANPTTAVNLSGTTIKTATDVETDTADIQSRLPAALVSGRIDASVGAMANNVLTASAINADAITAAKVAADVTAEIADGVWDEAIAGHLGAGSTGAALNAAGSAGDPWTTPLPGAYGSGTAGFIIGTNIDALISSRLASASYTAPLDAAGTATAVWNAATATYGAAGSYGLLIETNLDAAVSTRSTLDAAGVRSAVGLASANLDTQLADLPTATENADALLNRDFAAVSDSNDRTLLQAVRFLRNEWGVSGGTLSVYKENGSTLAWTKTVSTDPAAEPIVGVSN